MDNMKRLDFEKFLSLISNDLYSFAFILIPDDLQAGQLVVDSIQTYLISKKENLNQLFSARNADLNRELAPIKRALLKLVFELAKKRYHQIKLSISEKYEENDFYSLEFDEKSVLFLREKLKLSLEDIAVISGKTLSEVQAYLFSARTNMIGKIPYEIQAGVSI